MLTQQEKSQVDKTVHSINQVLVEVACNPDDYDFLKASVEIYELVLQSLREDLEIANNQRSYWIELASGAEK